MDGGDVGRRILLLGVILAGALYAWGYLDRGWVPHDEGSIGHSAERVADGQVPHRDFDEIYTGGLAYLNAAAFDVLGVRLTTPRRVLFVVFLLWLPVVFYTASRFAPPYAAALITALAVVWSIPNYSAAMPSWYNLFLATFGVSSLLKWAQAGTRRWLVLAGVCGGLSILAKITGLYFVAAAFLVIAFEEQNRRVAANPTNGVPDERSSRAARNRAYAIFISVAAAGLVAGLAGLIRRAASPETLFHFVLPGASLAALLVWREWRTAQSASGASFRRLFANAGLFVAGVALPIAAFLAPFAASGSLGDLATGLFVTPFARVDFASTAPFDLWSTLGWALPVLVVLAIARFTPLRVSGWMAGLLAIGLFGVWNSARDPRIYQFAWASMTGLIPIGVVIGAWVLSRRATPEATERTPERDLQLFALLATTGLCSLIQFPFSAPVYFLYIAPLGAVAALAIAFGGRPSVRPVFAVLVVFYVAFAVRWVNPGYIYQMSHYFQTDTQNVLLDLPRHGLRVTNADFEKYGRVIELVEQHAGPGPILATPDCPEIYFLTGRENPTRTLFDFFDDQADRPDRLLTLLEDRDIKTVVLFEKPGFSDPVGPAMARTLAERYPESETVGDFVVRWRP